MLLSVEKKEKLVFDTQRRLLSTDINHLRGDWLTDLQGVLHKPGVIFTLLVKLNTGFFLSPIQTRLRNPPVFLRWLIYRECSTRSVIFITLVKLSTGLFCSPIQLTHLRNLPVFLKNLFHEDLNSGFLTGKDGKERNESRRSVIKIHELLVCILNTIPKIAKVHPMI